MNENASLVLQEMFVPDRQTNLYMGLLLDDRGYIINAEQVSEVMKLPALTCLEKAPDYMAGLLNLRGKLIPVIDIRTFLGLIPKKYSTDNCLIVINTDNTLWGLIADQIIDVFDLDNHEVEAIPYACTMTEAKIVQGIVRFSSDIFALLNLENIFQSFIQTPSPEFTEQSHEDSTHLISSSSFNNDEESLRIFKARSTNLQHEIKELVQLGEDVNSVRFVTFLLNNETYALPIHYVKEFCSLENFATIPCVPDFILGIINLRGEFFALIDIKTFLWIKSNQFSPKSKVIIINSKDMNIGFVVDDVFDIISFPIPVIQSSSNSKLDSCKYTAGEVVNNAGEVITMLDIEKFLKDERLIIEDAV